MRYESNDLHGKKVLMLRAVSQNKALFELIERHGGVSLAIPLLSIGEPAEALKQAALALLAEVKSYDWLVFTSQNGVDYTLRYLSLLGIGHEQLPKIAVIGRKTLAYLEDEQLSAHFLPTRFVAETFVVEFAPILTKKDRVLVCKGNLARDHIATTLRAKSIFVDEAIVYENAIPEGADKSLTDLLATQFVDFIVFTSPSTVNHFMQIITRNGLYNRVQNSMMIAIGPVTKLALTEYGLTDVICPEQFTVEGILSKLIKITHKER